ncbi:hypothetical protein MNBD_GAMMA22-2108 [hydrothermal vent metagenome]|uniref:Uncharacterized protein n=1 Tax=hydrothermal vent metagenome TaxID=652676 RepID=A0A3B1ACW4_9ZZZZ
MLTFLLRFNVKLKLFWVRETFLFYTIIDTISLVGGKLSIFQFSNLSWGGGIVI